MPLGCCVESQATMADPLPDEIVTQINQAIFNGRKIEAIVVYRKATGCDLKSAKDFIESLQSQLWAESPDLFKVDPNASGCVRTTAMLTLAIAVVYLAARWIA